MDIFIPEMMILIVLDIYEFWENSGPCPLVAVSRTTELILYHPVMTNTARPACEVCATHLKIGYP